MNWVRMLDKKSSDRRIGLWAEFKETADGFALTLTDEDGFVGSAAIAQEHQAATDASKAEATLREQLGRFGATILQSTTSACPSASPGLCPPPP